MHSKLIASLPNWNFKPVENDDHKVSLISVKTYLFESIAPKENVFSQLSTASRCTFDFHWSFFTIMMWLSLTKSTTLSLDNTANAWKTCSKAYNASLTIKKLKPTEKFQMLHIDRFKITALFAKRKCEKWILSGGQEAYSKRSIIWWKESTFSCLLTRARKHDEKHKCITHFQI